MSNPFAAPASNNNIDDASVQIPEGQSWVVLSEFLYCRQDLNISDVCYWTGSRDVWRVKKSKIICLPGSWRVLATSSLIGISSLLILSGLMGAQVKQWIPYVWITLCIGMALVSHRFPNIALQFGQSFQGRKASWIRFLKACGAALLLVAARYLLTELPLQSWFPELYETVESESLTLGIYLLTFTLVLSGTRRTRAIRTSDGVFRVAGLPCALMDSLRKSQEEGISSGNS